MEAMNTIVQKLDELKRTHEEFKKENDARLDRLEKKGHNPADREEKLEKMNEALNCMTEKVEKLAAVQNRPVMDGKDVQDKAIEEKRKAYSLYYKKGLDFMTHEQKNNLSVGSEPDGGFTVRPEVLNQIVSKVFESSPVRQLAQVVTISSDAAEFLADYDEPQSGWVSEQETRSQTNTNQLKKIRIPAHELHASPKATLQILEDSGIDIEAWHAGKVAAKFSRDEATAFVSGTGTGQPRGFTTYSNGTGFGQIEQVVSGSGTLLTADGLINLQFSLKEPYQANAVWGMARATLGAVRKLKGDNDEYLIGTVDSLLKAGAVTSILGKPAYMMADMAAVGASALPVVYGDFKQGYMVVDRVGVSVLRDPYSAFGFVSFKTRKRVGGDVTNFEALKLQVVST